MKFQQLNELNNVHHRGFQQLNELNNVIGVPLVVTDSGRNQLSLSSAAEALGMTRRMIAHYRSGSRPIPKTVQLACVGWEA